ncbi:hypothetical protein [Gilvimarinus xylanilyticus]|uniref:Uncharacterized protein n=1 Tax=Gilvimarinus xylanilyticus TaxID=2944139 RepID=A0A9X2I273_9GAMM|nr:hypothetical protein [Gilvimarinus xylanilyticus]MCP8898776.1 hypothetical protein [Gilvimarinus xylanilyticus]
MADKKYRYSVRPDPGSKGKEYKGMKEVRVFSVEKPEDFSKFGPCETTVAFLLRAGRDAERCLRDAGYTPWGFKYYYSDRGVSVVKRDLHYVHKRFEARFAVYDIEKLEIAKTGHSPEFIADRLIHECMRAYELLNAGRYREAIEPCMYAVDNHHKMIFALKYERYSLKGAESNRNSDTGGRARWDGVERPESSDLQAYIDDLYAKNPNLSHHALCKKASEHFLPLYGKNSGCSVRSITGKTKDPNKK